MTALIYGRVWISVGLSLFVAWLWRDIAGMDFPRLWKARSILLMLAQFAGLAWWGTAATLWPELAVLTPWVYLPAGGVTLAVGVAVWVPTVRAWWGRR